MAKKAKRSIDGSKGLESVLEALDKAHAGDPMAEAPERAAPETSGLQALAGLVGGGWPLGRVMRLRGPSDSGKTTLATMIAGDVLAGQPKRFGLLMDFEHAAELERVRALTGQVTAEARRPRDVKEALDAGARMIVYRASTVEQAASLTDGLLETGDVAVLIHDSIATMQSMRDDEDGTGGMPEVPRFLSRWLPRHKSRLGRAGCLGLWLNHAKKQKFGHVGAPHLAPWYSPGGDAVDFLSDVRLFVRAKRIAKLRATHVKVERNKTSADRDGVTYLVLNRAGTYDLPESRRVMALEAGLIEKVKAGYRHDGTVIPARDLDAVLRDSATGPGKILATWQAQGGAQHAD